MEEEIWKDIPGWEGLYQASSHGRIRSVRSDIPKVLALGGGGRRYRSITLSRDGKTITKSVHRLVCMAFHGLPDSGMQVDHIDGDSHNNHEDNLRWCSSRDNHRNPITVERYRDAYNRSEDPTRLSRLASHPDVLERRGRTFSSRYSGVNNPRFGTKLPEETKRKIGARKKGTCCKPVIQMTREGGFVREWPSGSDAASALGLFSTNIFKCCKGQTASCGGFKWRYKNG